MRAGEWAKIGGVWHVKPPASERSGVTIHPPAGSVANHTVTEHEDGTITVSPSILITWYSYDLGAETTWHGYLERGQWREV